MPEILKIDANNPEEKVIAKATDILTGGGIIAYPTETFYGLGADATNEKAIQKIFSVKGRDFRNPISLIIGQAEDIYPLVQLLPEAARKLMKTFWPGALTIVFNASNTISPLLTAGSGKIGVRVSSHPIALKLVQKLKKPITATSANQSGKPECNQASEVVNQIGDKLDAVVDYGKTQGDIASTVVDVTCTPPAILREGAINRESIRNILSLS